MSKSRMGVLRTGDVKSQGRIQVPKSLKDYIVYEHPLDDDSVEWHYDNERRIAVLSSERDLDGFTYVKRSKVYGSPGQVRPPSQISDHLDGIENTDAAVYFSEEDSQAYLLFFPEERLFEELDKIGALFD